MAIQIKHLEPVVLTEVAQQISTDIIASTSITIQSALNNTGIVSIGGSDVALADGISNGIEIEPGESATIDGNPPDSLASDSVFRLSDIYALSTVSGDIIKIIYMTRVR